MSLVSFVKVEKEAEMKKGILDALDLIQYKLPTNIERVVIKPNLCYYWDYTTGQTTDPKFVKVLIEILREKVSSEADISIVESDASAMKCKYAFKMLGYEKLSQNYKVNLINLSKDKCDTVEVDVGNQSFRLMMPRTIRDAELKIALPKIKYTFERIKLSCALKNIFGCDPYPKKFKYHTRIEEAIVAINKAMKFDLCIIDGNIVSGVKPRRIGLIMASKDPVAIDAAAAKIAGINTKTIKYLSLATKEGLGNTNFIHKGMPLDYFKVRYPRKSIRYKLMGKAYGLIVTMGLSKKLGLD